MAYYKWSISVKYYCCLPCHNDFYKIRIYAISLNKSRICCKNPLVAAHSLQVQNPQGLAHKTSFGLAASGPCGPVLATAPAPSSSALPPTPSSLTMLQVPLFKVNPLLPLPGTPLFHTALLHSAHLHSCSSFMSQVRYYLRPGSPPTPKVWGGVVLIVLWLQFYCRLSVLICFVLLFCLPMHTMSYVFLCTPGTSQGPEQIMHQ